MKKLLILMILFPIVCFGRTRPHWLQLSGAPVIDSRSYGAKGDGITDDTAALQAAIDAAIDAELPLVVHPGHYKIARSYNLPYESYGLHVSDSISIIGIGSVRFSRLDSINTNITTIAGGSTGYPLIYVGVMDSTTVIEDVSIENITFIGDDKRHNLPGNSPRDFRTAIILSGVRGVSIKDCVFQAIDSSAIYVLAPGKNSWVNKKVYNATIRGNTFLGTPHETAQRKLMHAVAVPSVDNIFIEGNSFYWCDIGVSDGGSTYVGQFISEDETYESTDADGNTVNFLRGGKNLRIIGNSFMDTTEHMVYVGPSGGVISNNTGTISRSDEFFIGGIKVRGWDITIANNTITGRRALISVAVPSSRVTVTGNTLNSFGDFVAGVIGVSSFGISTYMTNRAQFWGDYLPMSDIVISSNVIKKDQPYSGDGACAAMRIYTDASIPAVLAGYDYTIYGVVVSNNSVSEVGTFIQSFNPRMTGGVVSGNSVRLSDVASSSVFWTNDVGNLFNYGAVSGNYFTGGEYYCLSADGVSNANKPAVTIGNKFRDFGLLLDPSFTRFNNTNQRFKDNVGSNVTDRRIPFNNSFWKNVGSASLELRFNNIRNLVDLATTTPELRFYYDEEDNFKTFDFTP